MLMDGKCYTSKQTTRENSGHFPLASIYGFHKAQWLPNVSCYFIYFPFVYLQLKIPALPVSLFHKLRACDCRTAIAFLDHSCFSLGGSTLSVGR